MPDDQAVAIRVEGAVQGIGFRAFVKKNADDFNVNGFVRNEPDGSVYIEAQGFPKYLRRFVEACRQGPDIARVERFVVEDVEPKRVFHFTIQ